MCAKTACEELPLKPAHRLVLLNQQASKGPFKVGQTIYCLVCGRPFIAETVFVYQEDGESLCECPVEGCDGSPLGFGEEPWWRKTD